MEASGLGGPCTPGRDECAANYRPCESGLACAADPSDPRRGTCERLTTIFCDPAAEPGSPSNRCEDGQFCARYGTLAEVNTGNACIVRPRLNTQQPLLGVCTRARLEGESCAAGWEQVNQPQPSFGRQRCNACAPGLVCFNNVCRRPCRDGEGGIGNCLPDQQARDFTTQWNCSPQTGVVNVGFGSTTIPLCSLCVPRRQPCELPPNLVLQSVRSLQFAANVCCDPNDLCALPLVLNGQPLDQFRATCCAPPTYQERNGGRCSGDRDCCSVILPVLGTVSRCCTSVVQQGCREIGRCAGCGPGTRQPCCDVFGRGCGPNQTCLTRSSTDDTARCIDCGAENSACCRRGLVTNCNAGLTCFSRPGETPTGDRCERCGTRGLQCCPGGRCEPGTICRNGACVPCGDRGLPCCADGSCGDRQRCVDGRCVQICGADGLPCCGTRGTFGGPRRFGYCLDAGVTCIQDPFVCRPCGAAGQPICQDSGQQPCQNGLGVDPRTGTCVTVCGEPGQPCCVDGSRSTCRAPAFCGGDGFCQRPPG